MANVLGAIAISEKRIRAKWDKIAENRAEIENICSNINKKDTFESQDSTNYLSKVEALFDANRLLTNEIEKLYLSIIKVKKI